MPAQAGIQWKFVVPGASAGNDKGFEIQSLLLGMRVAAPEVPADKKGARDKWQAPTTAGRTTDQPQGS